MSIRTRMRRGVWRLRTRRRAPGAHVEATSSLPLPPIFVGGTGRSGTSITGTLLGADPARYTFPQEVKFHSALGGLCDLVEGRATLASFEDRLLHKWYEREAGKGIQRFLDWPTIEAALGELRATFDDDPDHAAAAFTYRLLDPVAAANGASGWVEMTPTNVHAGPTLLRLFPGMRLVHSVRDGRDVACSVVRQSWGPTDLDAALDWWGKKLERGFAASDAMPADRVLVVQFEDLTFRDREAQFARLLAFLEIEDGAEIRDFFDRRMPAERAHIGRWREEVPANRIEAFRSRHARIATRLAARGRPYRPEVEEQVMDTAAGR